MTPAHPRALAPARAAIHLTPPVGWMGDPNGLIHVEGTFHAYYQHNPYDDVWGPMHWRHATSTDLLAWADQGVVLEPDDLGTIFSGCVVFDRRNSSGLARDRTAPLVAVFTHNGRPAQQQSLAYSLDGGSTWTKYDDNPVIASSAEHFRDPKVFWSGGRDDGHWVMSVAAGDRIQFYRSANLRSWVQTGEFSTGLAGSAGLWECPDLLRFGPNGPNWMLIVSVLDGGPAGHSGVVAIDGSFDGETFVARDEPARVDRGPDFYAAHSFSNLRSEVTWMGWMNSWRYANTHPSSGQRGIQSIPRVVTRSPDGKLLQTPVLPAPSRPAPSQKSVASHPNSAFCVIVSEEASIVVEGTDGPAAMLEVAPDLIHLDRSPWTGGVDPEIFGMARTSTAEVQVLIDHGSIEIFADQGRSVMTALTFPGPAWRLSIDHPLSADPPHVFTTQCE